MAMAEGKYAISQTDLFCPALDARRMDIYYSIIDSAGNIVKNVRAEIIDKDSLSDLPASSRIFIFGDGAAKCRDVIVRKDVVFDVNFAISAAFMNTPAYVAFDNRHFEDVAYFEPFYLKDFLTSKPVKNILGK
jgi:tRNA threonylcarbamoyladenosine biosynthesis protein TsaB